MFFEIIKNNANILQILMGFFVISIGFYAFHHYVYTKIIASFNQRYPLQIFKIIILGIIGAGWILILQQMPQHLNHRHILILASVLILIAYIDLVQNRIIHILLVPLVLLALYHQGNYGVATTLGFCFLGLHFICWHLYQKPCLGLGDIKLVFCLGLWLNMESLGPFLMLSGLYGITSAIIWRICLNEPQFPFAPALILSFMTVFAHQA